ncbi:MAG: ATP-dependent DNA helicase RecG [Acidobacteria bacterium RIFCSPLOWO2_02_FULL_67_36]|nr:MAG: ATP-dependent DNA helicase RecG [Acidobacteria bacterium RIFCSPLOWO2_02_FULL_67_36]OFW23366.1 MAG: ATP-dependent DNA helicase RecG [Acidobacteria bacterium RIFCSPLOWO2_12_FULL_66_21]
MIPLDTPLQFLKGVGPRRAADLQRVGLQTVEDLLYRFPIRYEDRGSFATIASLRPGTAASIAGEVVSCGVRPTRRPRFKIFELLVRDLTGSLRAVFFNQPFLSDVFHPHQRVILFGKLELSAHGLQLQNPQYEILRQEAGDAPAAPDADDDTLHTGRIVPVYEKTGTLTTRMQRVIVHRALAGLPAAIQDPLPADIRAREQLVDRRAALVDVHFPPAGTPIGELNAFRSPAQRRLIFEEFFLFQLGLVLKRRKADDERKARAVVVTDEIRESARRVLPFRLTGDQKKVIAEIVEDMKRPQPMNRLLQGDVGSGKTIVALMAALVAMENGLQVAFMAPTEILADQHFITIRKLLEASRFRIALLTGATPARKRRETQAELAAGSIHMVVGTHALVQDPVAFHDLGLAIIDEQHRFGVLQRATLRTKGLHPDVLVMTATPIPRTLALTTYGDLDVSVMREMPPGRHPIKTIAKPEARREEIYAFVRKQMDEGRQVYVIYPLIEESEKIDVKAATEMADHLAADIFPEYRVALLHGRLKQEEKERVMGAYARGDTHVLVSTTVVEVGVDVPNASVMLVEHAERFGLSQLHQLRGRVGRGPHLSYCVLLYQFPLSDQARERLKALTETTDGFVIAEKDLELRGPGDFFGTRQSGMPTLRVGDLVRDHAIMEAARREAVAALDDRRQAETLAALVRTGWEQRFGLAGIG